MAIQSIFTWNENDTANTRDYSTNGNDSTAMAVTSIVNADIAKAVNLDGTDDSVRFGDINNFSGTDNFTIVAKLTITSNQENPVAYKEDHFTVGVDVNKKAFLRVTVGASEYELVAATTIPSGFQTIVWTYDGSLGSANGKIYTAGTVDANTLAQTGNLDTTTNNFFIGTDGTAFFNGQLEVVAAYSQTFTQAEVTAVTDKPGGFKLNLRSSTGFSNGDLLEVSAKGATAAAQCVVTGDLGSNQLLVLPLLNDIPQPGDVIKHVGNVYDTARQCIMKSELSSSAPIMRFYDNVTSFTLPAPTVQIDCNGITNTAGSIGGYKAITATYTVLATDSFLDITSGTFTATLPTAVGISGKEYTFKNSGTGVATIDGDGTETLDGDLTVVMAVQYGSITIKSDGANWLLK